LADLLFDGRNFPSSALGGKVFIFISWSLQSRLIPTGFVNVLCWQNANRGSL
jgi:hypothetical protein